MISCYNQPRRTSSPRVFRSGQNGHSGNGVAPKPAISVGRQRDYGDFQERVVKTVVSGGRPALGLVGFHDNAFVIGRLADPADPLVFDRIFGLHERVGGTGTNLADGLSVGIDLLDGAHPALRKSLVIVSDGVDNRDTEKLDAVIARARESHVVVTAVPMGDNRQGPTSNFDCSRMQKVADATGGKLWGASALLQLADNLKRSLGPEDPTRRKATATVVACDLSQSMMLPWGDKTRVKALQQALIRLALVTQKL